MTPPPLLGDQVLVDGELGVVVSFMAAGLYMVQISEERFCVGPAQHLKGPAYGPLSEWISQMSESVKGMEVEPS